MLGCVDQSAVATVEIFLDCDRHRCGLTCGKIVAPDVTGLLEYDRVFAERRKLDVEISEVRELLRFFCCEINDEQVHPIVAVGDKIDFVVWSPHRADILGWIVRQVFGGAGVEIVNPNVIRHAAAIMFPCAELPEHAVERHL